MQPSHLLIKICGTTNAADARGALDAGADWIGLNLVAGPRRLDLARAVEIAGALADPAAAVALVAVDDPLHEEKVPALARAGVRRFQLYGGVTPAHIVAFADRGLETILARHVGGPADLAEANVFLRSCMMGPSYVLIDANVLGQQGGTGERADWQAIEDAKRAGHVSGWPPTLLAGGLNVSNVAEAIARVNPAGVDVSSSVESRPGVKDLRRVRAFIAAARP